MSAEQIDTLLAQLQGVRENVARVVVGQEAVVEQLLVTLLAAGHCLLEGVPGLAKTLLVKTLAQSLSLDFRRIQFTPDLMPSDVIGTQILEEDHTTGGRVFTFQRGPVFTHLLLADEINRTPPKTQAALLEAMQERSVSYAGESHVLEAPFFVMATQNPIEQAGTYALPEAQLDRFLLNVHIDYPSETEEREIIARTTDGSDASVSAVLEREVVIRLQGLVREVNLSDALLQYIVTLTRATRPQHSSVAAVNEWIKWGAGPRAGQALALAAKARALLCGRYGATLEDVQAMVLPVLRHRVLLNFHAEAEGKDVTDVVATLLEALPAPAAPTL
ncbi:MAG: MoxR family ATPase [Pseudomonadota bacterium]